jgi:hypothetical protein
LALLWANRDPGGVSQLTAPAMRWQIALVSALVLLFTVHTFHYIPEIVDDAFITFRYALNLAQGRGFVFNPGELVEGTSAPLFTALLAAILVGTHSAPDSLLEISRAIGVGSCIASMVIIYLLATRVYHLSWLAGLLILLGLALNPYFAFWSINGMETTFHGFLLLAIFSAFEYSRLGPAQLDTRHSTPVRLSVSIPLITAGIFLICASRPEAPAFAGAYVIYRMIDATLKNHFPRALQWMVAGVLGLGLFLGARYAYFGEILPNTYYAKILANGPSELPGWLYIVTFFAPNLLVGLLNALACIGLLLAFRRDHIIHLILLVGSFAFAFYSHGDWMFNFRFAIPALPSYLLLLVYGLLAWRSPCARFFGAYSGVAIALLLGLLVVSWSTRYLIYRERPYVVEDPLRENKASLLPNYLPGDPVTPLIVYPGSHVLNYCRADERVMMPDIGLPAFIIDNPVLDTRGLTDKTTARMVYQFFKDPSSTESEHWQSLLTASLDTAPPCAVTLLPQIFYPGENHFLNKMRQGYVKIDDDRTYIRKPAALLPLADRVSNWHKAWSRIPRSQLILAGYIDTLVEAKDIESLRQLDTYYMARPRLYEHFKSSIAAAIAKVQSATSGSS